MALSISAGYHAVITASAWRARCAGRTRTPVPATPQHRFCVLVPAHDEERLIGSTLKSIAELDYPEPLVTVHVVADNCSDGTAATALGHGAEVHERSAPDDPGKGPALQWLIAELDERALTYDAAVFVDADTVVDRRFLRVVDSLLADGADVVQGYYAVRDPDTSHATGFRAAALAARHHLRPLGRTELGGSAGLYGNGMVFRADVLRRHGWSSHLTEDMELQLLLLLDGIPVAFAPDAVVEAEMPATAEASTSQRERWERGRLDLARRFVPTLARRAVGGGPAGRVAYADAALDALLPPFSVLAAGSVALTLASVVGSGRPPSPVAWRRALGAVVISAAHGVYVLSALRLADAPSSAYRSLLRAPRFVAAQIDLWLRALLRRRDLPWVRTARNADEEPQASWN